MLSKRVIAQSLYTTPCPTCSFRTTFAASNIIQREFRNDSGGGDYNVISYDIKCQLCLSTFQPARHRTANVIERPMKAREFTALQLGYISKMRSYFATVPDWIGGIRLGQSTNEIQHKRRFDNVSVFMVDTLPSENHKVAVYITGQNLTPELLACQLGVEDINEIPVGQAMAFHLSARPRIEGDVSHVTRM